uniref:flagellar motor switch protein FliM n=1 Tax=Eubacterium cellulosolvens TaxID=29322 RepID=UPI00048506F6|nr:FliM/FliN family flagellar motor switch protein [[Eubacterium] cellulosolvens]
MADVLSQSQIDALLQSMKGSPDEPPEVEEEPVTEPEDDYNKYDFYSPRKFTKEKLKLLRSIFENYARILTSQVNGIFRTMTDITVMELRESRYYEYVNSFHENDCMTIIDTVMPEKGKFSVPMMIYVTPGLILTLMSHMLGGGEQVISTEENYRYSDVEMSLYKRILEYIIHALGDGFSNYLTVDFRPQKVEENPSMIQEVGLDETVVLVHLNVDVTGIASEKIRICIPGTLLEQIFRTIDNRKHIARGFTYSNNSEVIMSHIKETKFPLTAQLGTVRLTMEDLYRLQVGDVIDMNKSKDATLSLFVGKQPWFRGTMGVHHKNIAIEICERIEEEEVEAIRPSGLEEDENELRELAASVSALDAGSAE